MGNSKTLIMEKKNAFMKIWECRDLGPISEYLCMKIVRDRIQKKLIIDQIDYTKKVVECFGQQNAKPTYMLKMRPSVAATDYKCCSSCLTL